MNLQNWAREIDPSIPILLQSTERKNETLVKDVKASFLHKNSPTLLNDLRSFMIDNFGFGFILHSVSFIPYTLFGIFYFIKERSVVLK